MFRVIFGLTMLMSTLRFIILGWIEDQYTQPMLHFSYFGFGWVHPMDQAGMYAVFILMAVCSVSIALGLFYRLSIISFFLLFGYVELIDVSYYLNHYYFVSLASFLMIWVPAHRYFSLDVQRNPHWKLEQVPRWCVAIFKLQLGLVYFYAGLAKINADWLLNALPLKVWLPAKDTLPLIGWLFRFLETAYIFSWGGMLYDVSIPFFLLYRPTRLWAYLAVIGFHVMTGLLFQIGVFPLVMIMFTLIFFSESFHRSMIDHLRRCLPVFQRLPQAGTIVPTLPGRAVKWRERALLSMLTLHFLIQIIFPWRYLLYPGNLFWTEEGYRFSWRVMLMEKAGTATFYVKDSRSNREGVVNNREFLNAHQEKQMAMQPDMILQFAHFLARHYEKRGVYQPQVRAEVYVTLNARPSRLLIDPRVNLVEKKDGWRTKNWIIPWEDEQVSKK
ncbi:MAG: HTTM domain-containing protein [Bacteroidia bacterium]|nr:HTTM domain-containing protein [Bacteroidia bacterium]